MEQVKRIPLKANYSPTTNKWVITRGQQIIAEKNSMREAIQFIQEMNGERK